MNYWDHINWGNCSEMGRVLRESLLEGTHVIPGHLSSKFQGAYFRSINGAGGQVLFSWFKQSALIFQQFETIIEAYIMRAWIHNWFFLHK